MGVLGTQFIPRRAGPPPPGKNTVAMHAIVS